MLKLTSRSSRARVNAVRRGDREAKVLNTFLDACASHVPAALIEFVAIDD